MKTFKFQAKTKFIAGPNAAQNLGTETALLGVDNILVVTDQGIVNAGLLDAVLAPLRDAEIKTAVYDQVSPNPTDRTAQDGAAAAKECGAQALIALGGGSPIDAAKAMAVMATSGAGGLGVIHSLAQTLGGFYDLPHGLTIAVCFADGLAYNLPVLPEKCTAVAQMLGTDTSGMTPQEAAQSVIPAIEQINIDLNVTDTFESMKVQREDIPQLAKYAMLDGCTPTNPRPLAVGDFVELFENGFAEG